MSDDAAHRREPPDPPTDHAEDDVQTLQVNVSAQARAIHQAMRHAAATSRLGATAGRIATHVADQLAALDLPDLESQLEAAMRPPLAATGRFKRSFQRIAAITVAAGSQLAEETDKARPENWRPDHLHWQDVLRVEDLAVDAIRVGQCV